MIIVPVIIGGLSSRKDKTWRITVETQELSPEKTGQLSAMNGQFGFMAFKSADFNPDEEDALGKLAPDLTIGKTPSQRLRNVLHVLYLQDPEGHEDFKKYYEAKMERVITHFKNKILP